jgi:hypothetical protein
MLLSNTHTIAQILSINRMRLNSNWSMEGQYANFAADTVVYTDKTTTREGLLSGKSFGVAGLYHFNPQGSYSPFVKLGWHHWSFKNKENVSASGNHEHQNFFQIGHLLLLFLCRLRLCLYS